MRLGGVKNISPLSWGVQNRIDPISVHRGLMTAKCFFSFAQNHPVMSTGNCQSTISQTLLTSENIHVQCSSLMLSGSSPIKFHHLIATLICSHFLKLFYCQSLFRLY